MRGARAAVEPAGPEFVPRLLFLPHVDDDYAGWSGRPVGVEPHDDNTRYSLFGGAPEDAGQLFWFRWIVGHQVSFLLWRTMADLVREGGGNVPGPREAAELASCVDGYSAMLLYASTIPPSMYHSDIRVRMALQHPAFSGTWAPDYRPVSRLLRARSSWLAEESCAGLAVAVDRNRAVHDHIADHLVPDGRSLLHRSAGSAGAAVSGEKEDLFDNFFMTIRRPTGRGDVVAQFVSRIDDVALDLRRHGLYPRVDGRHHPVLAPDTDAGTTRLVADVPAVLHRAARPAGRTLQEVY